MNAKIFLFCEDDFLGKVQKVFKKAFFLVSGLKCSTVVPLTRCRVDTNSFHQELVVV